ncbi:MAG TPA: hypothetical protein VFW78_11570 [Bacteroidia bacterium]|nr:hypothetical protein [Bacteroidia bacterium]
MARTANQAILARYFNTGQFNRHDLIVGGLSPSLLFKRNASRAITVFNNSHPHPSTGNALSYSIPHYKGSVKAVTDISDYLKQTVSPFLVGAYVHGSLATDENIGYSDFDGLLILKNELFKDPVQLKNVAEHISKTYSLMIQFDPLQHHGWFILTESDLSDFPNSYFPTVLFDHAASLLEQGTSLKINTAPAQAGFSGQLKRLAHSVIGKLDSGKGMQNMYTLKGMLSEFMLLPSLYLECKTGQGVFKKYSFEQAKCDFQEHEWSIMDEVSGIRSGWNYHPSWTLNEVPVCVTPLLKKIQARNAGSIPDTILNTMDAAFTDRMRILAKLFIERSV